MRIIIIKNVSDGPDTWQGQYLDQGESYQLQTEQEREEFATDEKVNQDLWLGNLVVGDGEKELAPPFGDSWLKNVDLTPKDSDGSAIIITKHTKTGWHYEPRSLDFSAGVAGSLYNLKHDGNGMNDGTDYGDATLKFFDDQGGELSFQQTGHDSETDVQFQARLTANCVRTEMDWQPQYDMDIIGGILMVKNVPTEDAYMWTVVAPEIPEIYGGEVPHVAGGWNLSFFNNKDKIQVNGRGSKTVVYDPVYNSNKFRTIIKHAKGDTPGVQMIYEHFKG